MMNKRSLRHNVSGLLFLGLVIFAPVYAEAFPIGGHPDKCKGGVPDGAFSCANSGGTVACTNDGDYMCCKKNAQGGQDCEQIETMTSNPKGNLGQLPGGQLQVAPVNPQPSGPRVPKAGMTNPIMRRGVEGEAPDAGTAKPESPAAETK
jgi:hypothetical protein